MAEKLKLGVVLLAVLCIISSYDLYCRKPEAEKLREMIGGFGAGKIQ